MPIEVKSGIDAGTFLTAAAAAGQGQTRNQFQMGQLQAEEQRRRLARQQEFTASQAELTRGARIDLQDRAQDIREEDFEFRLTAEQEKQERDFDVAEGRVRTDSTLTEEERAQALHQLEAKRTGIKPVRRRKGPDAAAKFAKNTFTDEAGNIFPIDPVTGVPGKPIFQPPSTIPTVQDRIKAVTAATAAAQTEEGFSQPKFDAAMRRMGFGKEGAVVSDTGGGGKTDLPAGDTRGGVQPVPDGGGAAPEEPTDIGALPGTETRDAAEVEVEEQYERFVKTGKVLTGFWDKLTADQRNEFLAEAEKRKAASPIVETRSGFEEPSPVKILTNEYTDITRGGRRSETGRIKPMAVEDIADLNTANDQLAMYDAAIKALGPEPKGVFSSNTWNDRRRVIADKRGPVAMRWAELRRKADELWARITVLNANARRAG